MNRQPIHPEVKRASLFSLINGGYGSTAFFRNKVKSYIKLTKAEIDELNETYKLPWRERNRIQWGFLNSLHVKRAPILSLAADLEDGLLN